MDNEKTAGLTQQKSADKSKRFFIKKASAAAGIATLAPTSVWGACNASGVSGGSQNTNTSCAMPDYEEGRNPAFWAKWLKDHPTDSDKRIVNWAVTDISSDDEKFNSHNAPNDYWIGRQKRYYYYHKVADTIKKIQFNVKSMDKDGNETVATINVYQAITGSSSNSIQAHLAAVYLNRLFGYSKVTYEYQTQQGFNMLLDHYYGMSMHVDSFTSDINARYRSIDTTESSLKAGIALYKNAPDLT
jgi:hypothetical protein